MIEINVVGVVMWGGGTDHISVCLQIALVHFLPNGQHKPDLFQTIAQTYSSALRPPELTSYATGFVYGWLF